MARSEFHRAVDTIQASIRPWLRDRGFRCRARTFNRVTDDGLTQAIGIQMGPFDPPGTTEIPGLRENLHGWFTVNLGVYVPEVGLYHYGGAATWIAEAHCTLRTRLARVSGGDRDLWWRAEACAEVIDDVLGRLSVGGLPWLDRFASRDQILAELDELEQTDWVRTPRIVSAIIHVARGEVAPARTLLTSQENAAASTHPGHAKYVREFAVKLGLGPLDR